MNGLTPKQNKLTQVLTRQIAQNGKTNFTKAGLEVFNTDNPESARVMAQQEFQNPTVKEALELALRSNGITPEVLTQEIKDLATKQVDKISGDVKLKANVELLKLLGVYPGSKSAHLNVNLSGRIGDKGFNEVKEELKVIDDELKDLLTEDP